MSHAELYAAWQPQLLRFCARLLGSSHDAEEVVQDVFARLLERPERFTLDQRPAPLLYTLARNRCMDLRRRRRSVTLPDEASVPGPDRELAAGLLLLPDKEREVLLLTVQEGLTYADVAQVLGCSIATVAARKYAALARLKRRLSS
jgi:RNA polymerase sigma-70 factor (ECF subfamily)